MHNEPNNNARELAEAYAKALDINVAKIAEDIARSMGQLTPRQAEGLARAADEATKTIEAKINEVLEKLRKKREGN